MKQPLTHEQRTEVAGLIAGLAIVALLALAVVIQAGWFGLQPAPATRPVPFGPGAQVENAGAIWQVDRVSWDMAAPAPVATVVLRAKRGQSPGDLTIVSALGACRAILGQGLAVPGTDEDDRARLVTNWTLRVTYLDARLRHLGTFEVSVVDYRLRAQSCKAAVGRHQAPEPQAQGQEFLKDGARWRVGQLSWDRTPDTPLLRVMIWHQDGTVRVPVGPDLARDLCGVVLRLGVPVPTYARHRPWTMRMRILDATGRYAGPFDLGVGQTPTSSPYCFARPAAGDSAPGRRVTPQAAPAPGTAETSAPPPAPEHPIHFVFPLRIGESWMVTVLLAHPGTGDALTPPGADEARRVCAEILAALPSPFAPGMTPDTVGSILVSYRYEGGKGKSGPSRKITVSDGACEAEASAATPTPLPVPEPTPVLPLRTYVTAKARWPLMAVDWRATDQGQTLLASFGPARELGSGAPSDVLLPYQVAALCRAIMAHPLPGAPEGVRARDVARLGLRVARPEGAGQGGPGRFGGWIFRNLWGTDCDGVRPAAAPGQEVVQTSAVNLHIVARGAVVGMDRETWLRHRGEGGKAGEAGEKAAGVELRLHVSVLTARDGDRPISLTPLTRWSLCNSVLANLPARTRTGLTRDDIAFVSFRVDGQTDARDQRQDVRDGICVLPEGARIGAEK